jgi:CDGSH-type Zn-finger protein
VPPEPVRRRVTLTDEGPVLVHGPVEVILADGRKVTSDRAVTALCMCRRSGRYPFCDTSHRRRVRPLSSDRVMGSPGQKC